MDGETLARVGYLALILAALGGWVLVEFRQRMGQALRMALASIGGPREEAGAVILSLAPLGNPLAMVIALALTWGVPRALWLRLALLGSLATALNGLRKGLHHAEEHVRQLEGDLAAEFDALMKEAPATAAPAIPDIADLGLDDGDPGHEARQGRYHPGHPQRG